MRVCADDDYSRGKDCNLAANLTPDELLMLLSLRAAVVVGSAVVRDNSSDGELGCLPGAAVPGSAPSLLSPGGWPGGRLLSGAPLQS